MRSFYIKDSKKIHGYPFLFLSHATGIGSGLLRLSRPESLQEKKGFVRQELLTQNPLSDNSQSQQKRKDQKENRNYQLNRPDGDFFDQAVSDDNPDKGRKNSQSQYGKF